MHVRGDQMLAKPSITGTLTNPGLKEAHYMIAEVRETIPGTFRLVHINYNIKITDLLYLYNSQPTHR